MNYAIVKIQGKQYKVQVGDKIVLDNLDKQAGDKITFAEVLLTRNGDEINVGTPHLSGLSVTGTVVGNQKGEKIRVFKYKAKSRYRKTKGFRASQTVVEVSSIGSENEKPTPVKKTTKTGSKASKKIN